MYTVSIVIDQAIVRREFACFMLALDMVRDTVGEEICAFKAYSDVISGRGVTMFVRGAYVGIARLN